MMENKLYTIKEIAEAVNVSKPTIVKAISALGITAAKRDEGTKKEYYSPAAAASIIDYMKTAKDNRKPQTNAEGEPQIFSESEPQTANENRKTSGETQNYAESEPQTANQQTEAVMADMIKLLREQLAAKDKQIEQLQQSLQDALTITKQQQFLIAADKQEQSEHKDMVSVSVPDPEEAENNEQPGQGKRKNLFQRLFRRS